MRRCPSTATRSRSNASTHRNDLDRPTPFRHATNAHDTPQAARHARAITPTKNAQFDARALAPTSPRRRSRNRSHSSRRERTTHSPRRANPVPPPNERETGTSDKPPSAFGNTEKLSTSRRIRNSENERMTTHRADRTVGSTPPRIESMSMVEPGATLQRTRHTLRKPDPTQARIRRQNKPNRHDPPCR